MARIGSKGKIVASGFNINKFIGAISKNSLLRANKFLVRFPLPRGLARSPDFAFMKETSRYLELWTEAANLPSVLLPTSEVRRYGYGNFEKKPYSISNNDVNLSLLCDGRGAVWTMFQQWLKLIVNFDLRAGIRSQTGTLPNESPFEIAYKEDYVSDVNIIAFDDAGTPRISVILRDAYPIFIGDIPLNWGNVDEVLRVPLVFTMFDWYNEFMTVNTGTAVTPITPVPGVINGPTLAPPGDPGHQQNPFFPKPVF